jgi:hypothetical protein
MSDLDYDKGTLKAYIYDLEARLKERNAEIERLALDVKILVEELERERLPKRDER